ncbi:hypothetical protein [Polyangium mundeleinium]|uniref:Uncharacterized protein n=1 Tax=Polyangium mundeleinium TaxID=2995306 RepID=A0ABT5EZI3_9BACT|nr:hypothetical protein [Polyangium mundeleinium]MDC0746677.1 hypothetical protein [Polyangium mundeleinium]
MKTLKALRCYLLANARRADAEARLLNADASRQYLAAVEEIVTFMVALFDRPAPTQAAGAPTSSSSAGAPTSSSSAGAPTSSSSAGAPTSSASTGPASDVAPPPSPCPGPAWSRPPSPSPFADEELAAGDELDQALEVLGELTFPGMVALARRYKAVEALKYRLNGRGLANDDPEQLLEAVVRLVEWNPAGVPTGA